MRTFVINLRTAAFIILFTMHLVVGTAPAQTSKESEEVDALQMALKKAINEENPSEAAQLCDKILARDVVSDFIDHAGEMEEEKPADTVMRALKQTLRKLDSQVAKWEDELTRDPESERLNYLLFAATLKTPGTSRQASGRSNYYLPLQIRILRDGSIFTGQVLLKSGRWDTIDSAKIAMGEKALFGFVCSTGKCMLKNPVLTIHGQPVSQPVWEQRQIANPDNNGEMKQTDNTLLISGAGYPLESFNDTLFFAFREVEGNGALEVAVESLDPQNSSTTAGLMVRSSLDPGATYASLTAERRENTLWFGTRLKPDSRDRYLSRLCGSRPKETRFVFACVHEMVEYSLWTDAVQALDRLLSADPAALAFDPEFVHRVFMTMGKEQRLSELTGPAKDSPGNEESLASSYAAQGDLLLNAGRYAEAVEVFRKLQALTPGQPLPFEIRQKLITSLYRLERSEDTIIEIQKLFLGENPDEATTLPCEQILSDIGLDFPCLVPPSVISIHMAAHYGIAMAIAGKLDKAIGRPDQKAAAKCVAEALRLAARDPGVPAKVKKGYALGLPSSLPPAGLALIAFELQQSEQGRPEAVSLIKQLLGNPGSAVGSFDRVSLLQWRAWLAEMNSKQGERNKPLDELVQQLLNPDEDPNDITVSWALLRLLQHGDLKTAAALASAYEQKHPRPGPDRYDQLSEALDLLEVHQGKVPPMPVIWTLPTKGDAIDVYWEYSNAHRDVGPLRETRALGVPIPALDGKYDLELYAFRGEMLSRNFDKFSPEDLIGRVPAASSRGVWTGKIPPDRRWLVVLLRDQNGPVNSSPAIPAASGINLISPIRVADVLAKKGSWKASPWMWGTEQKGDFPKESVFVSRLQPHIGTQIFRHELVPINPDADYVFSAWLRTSHGQGGQSEAAYEYIPDATLQVTFLDSEGNPVVDWEESAHIGGRWSLLTKHFSSRKGAGIVLLPPQVSKAEVRLVLKTQCEIGDIGLYTDAAPIQPSH